jgi:hypothetical protein
MMPLKTNKDKNNKKIEGKKIFTRSATLIKTEMATTTIPTTTSSDTHAVGISQPYVLEIGTKRGAWTEDLIRSEFRKFLNTPFDESGRKPELDVIAIARFSAEFLEDFSSKQEVEWTGPEKKAGAVRLANDMVLRLGLQMIPESERREVSKRWLSQNELMLSALDNLTFTSKHPNRSNRNQWEPFVEEEVVRGCCGLWNKKKKRDPNVVCPL